MLRRYLSIMDINIRKSYFNINIDKPLYVIYLIPNLENRVAIYTGIRYIVYKRKGKNIIIFYDLFLEVLRFNIIIFQKSSNLR